MRILMLVISSDTFPVYKHHREVWKTYMKSHPEVDCYFIRYTPLTFVPLLTQDTLTLRGRERYGTIFQKTVESMEYFLSRRLYDYVVRTNLSSVWHFPNLLAYLATAPRERYYAGHLVTHQASGLLFASGAGFILSSDVARIFLANAHRGRTLHEFDDVAVASVLLASGIGPQSLPRVDFVSLAHYEEHRDEIPPGSFHFRMKHHDGYLGDRMEEPEMMRRVLREHIYAA
jgi:hypothetical protein